MRSPFKKHVPPLNKSFLNEFVATLRGLSRFTSTGQKDSTFLIFNRHEVGRYLYVHDVRPVRVRPEIVHKQIVSIVNEEVKSVEHFFVVADERHFQILVYHFFEFRFCFIFFMN